MGLFFNRKSNASAAPAPSRPASKVRPYSGDIFNVSEIPASKFFREKGIKLKRVYCYITCYAAVDEDGNLWSWSDKGSDGSSFMKNRPSETPIKILDSVKKPFISNVRVLREDGSLWEWDGFGYRHYWDDDERYCFENDNWKLISRDVVDADGRILIDSQGSMYVMGYNSNKLLDPNMGENETIRSPRLFARDVIKAKDFGQNMGMIKRDGSLWLWGLNYGGQIGNGNTDEQLMPFKALTNVKDFFETGWAIAAIKNDDTLWMWGKNEYALIGNGSFRDQLAPIKVMDRVTSFFFDSIGSGTFSGAITADGSLWMWGRNQGGRFMCEPNTGSTETFKEPRKLFDDVKEFTSFGSRILAIKKDGTAWAWGGFGDYGADETDGFFSSKRFTPQKVLSNANYLGEVWASECFIVKNDGSIWSVRDRSTEEHFNYLHSKYGKNSR